MRRTYKTQGIDRLLPVLLMLFLIGSCIGCWVVRSSQTGQLSYSVESDVELLPGLWRAAQFHVLIGLGSFLSAGVLLIPASVMLRGYFLACGAAVVSSQGFAAACVTCGLPALLQLPSLFCLACAGMRMSAALRDGIAGRKDAFRKSDMGKQLLWSAVGIVLCTWADIYIVPLVLERILL